MSCAVCGLLIALSGTYADKTESANFIVIIIGGARSPLNAIINILLFTSIAYFAVFLASLHFGFFVLFYGGIIAGSLYMFRVAFVSVSVDGILGFVLLIFFILPVLLFNLFAITVLLSKVYDHCGYCSNRKRFITLACFPRRLISDILSFYSAALIFTYSLWLIIYLLVLIIC